MSSIILNTLVVVTILAWYAAAGPVGSSSAIPDNWRDYLPADAGKPSQPYMSSLYQGDIALPSSQTRTAHKDPNRRWENRTVPYTVTKDFNEKHIAIIEKGHRDIEAGTCIRFKPRTNELDYIEYVNNGGCFSAVGRQGGRQELSLALPGCVTVGIVTHETLHAIGFYHEQSRSDRDDNIIINYDNIEERDWQNFQKEETNNLNTPYDLNSIMHYGAFDFAKDSSKPAMVPKKMGSQIGQRVIMTDIDKQRVRTLYQCDGTNYTIDKSGDLTPGCSGYWTTVAGDTCEKTAQICGVDLTDLYALNPKLKNGAECSKLTVGSKLCCDIPSTATPAPGCQGWWQLRKPDTCDAVASICKITLHEMFGLNPFWEDGKQCKNIQAHVGKMVCCKKDGSTTPIPTTTKPTTAARTTSKPRANVTRSAGCQGWWQVSSDFVASWKQSGTPPCQDTANICQVSPQLLYQLNPSLEGGKKCDSLQAGDIMCCNNPAVVSTSTTISSDDIDRAFNKIPR